MKPWSLPAAASMPSAGALTSWRVHSIPSSDVQTAVPVSANAITRSPSDAAPSLPNAAPSEASIERCVQVLPSAEVQATAHGLSPSWHPPIATKPGPPATTVSGTTVGSETWSGPT